ncbi:MAG: helicase-exonuclease AddAB subunit AddB [Candidatus Pristimantibacillus lignocellulolyticus]|uniref:ATP-dependent helicase/deoxyribonuclease subunit B n=1 Tax=Candidatus Pristimantibacillus lignocellulolyticus TaxID=2994561 RepID=A0A9J6ZDU7_9BACL|nr:MAG: helicase-exonuclease AddAB subunit AddB [Candidatus Pristimantibacillus lignocellulolyticus]
MSVRFILGRAGSGKTHYCLEQIRNELKSDPLGSPLILLTPEQASFQMEYELIDQGEPQGMLRAQALSFRRLAFRVMQETGGTALVPITETGKHMLLYKLVNRYASELQLFKNSEDQAGFIERLVNMITEWKRYGVSAEQVQQLIQTDKSEYSQLLQKKLHDMGLLYRYMEQELHHKYVDSEDYLSYMVQGLPHASSLKGCRVWVDGFHGLTPTEYEALGALMANSAHMTIALTLDREFGIDEPIDELNLFHQTAETYQRIAQLAEQYGIEIEESIILQSSGVSRFGNVEALAFLEKNYGKRKVYEPSNTQWSQDSAIQLAASANRRAEIEEIARQLLIQVHEHGYRWRDMAVLVRNLDGYSDYIELVFRRYQIPFFMDQKQKTLYHPFVEFISSALESIVHGWQYDAMFRCIKTEMLFPQDETIPREWFDILENYVLASGINGWKWNDTNYWKALATISLDEEEETAYHISDKAQRELDISLAARGSIMPPLEQLSDKLTKASNVRQMCQALYELLDDAQVAQRLERWSDEEQARGNLMMARTHRQLWGNVMGLLDELVELAGDEQVSTELFAGMIQAGLDSLQLASIPPSMDQVVIGTMERTRLSNVKACYIIGASDGVLPMRLQEDGLLSEADREQLVTDGLAMAPSSRRKLLDERFLIYQILTRASSKLWISYPLADEEGKSILPSEIIRQIRSQFPMINVQHIAIEPHLRMSEQEQRNFLAHPDAAMTYLIVMLREWKQGKKLPSLWWDLYNWYAIRPEYAHKLTALLRSLQFNNIEMPLQIETARGLYGSQMRMSVSRVERFVSCPFQHFSIYGLRLKERKQYRLEAPDMGQLFHAALGKLANQLGSSWGRMSHDKVKQEVSLIVDQLVPRLQSQILLSSERFRYIARKLKEIVMQAAIMLGEHAGRAEFNPVGTEVDFGPNGNMPALQVQLDNGNMLEIVGRIDRIDAAESDQGLLLRVLDYKSSSKALKLDEVIHGLSLQMLTYLDVLMTHGEGWLKQKVSPAGVLYFHVHNPLLQVKNRISSEEADDLMLKRYKMKGLLTADTTVVRMMDSELETGYSQILPVAVKKDDSFYSSASVVSHDQWDMLRGFVKTKIKNIGQEIQEGVVSVEPYQLADRTPCQFCDYKPVCQFDPVIEGNQYRKLAKTSEDEIWRELGE